ncbi:hypothetical protein [Citrobacter amalonaticus]|uniref:hypothetical protein n=1 Tax=Citrobacter amalonaticus TaxID=35703 RepID=UPI001A1FEF56|nr:hypothetical protein [Citrobacter amalonaticus]HDQ2811523.1 hypothetical protein [Citrobacter amalonaticus]
MDSNISELVKLGHERADELKAACGAVDVRSVAQLISDLASQLEVQYVRAEESQREFRSADITMQNLEAKCEKLAAENAGLKAAAEFATAEDMWIEQHDGMLDYRYSEWYVDVLKSEMETPATDAFLAEVRASAIDSLVNIKTKQLADMHPDTHAFGATSMSIRSQINELQVFAAQLRKGAAL